MTNTSESNLPLKNGSLNAGDGEAMATQLDGVGVGIGIGAIAHEIGLTKDTLRVWERRYGFPQPLRSTGGERLYPQEQVTKLRLVKRLLDAGHRPSKVLPQSIALLQQLAEDSGVGQDAPDVELDKMVELLRSGRYDDFRFELLKRATREGLAHFVLDVAAPLSARIGNAWAAGTLQVYHEHLFSEAMQVTLRSLMRPLSEALRGRGAHPRVLLTTLPGEGHGLGILMAEAMFALAGCECIALGVQTPPQDIIDAIPAHEVDVLALSFSASVPVQSVVNGLTDLRQALPAKVAIWVGGSSPALRRKLPDGILTVNGLAPIEEAVAEWRQNAML
ncbi:MULTISPECIES: MerR family transcriptional regulator [Burkholderiaceae]|jgi:MerR family transcriptional regulator, light-induced transcriptional regulator|nr:MerR family transcriptional regulator [Burkholderia sp. PAMC 26561]AMM12792.1 MerR family transcriptional regulator [Burkholderia sp. PAMC 28687]